MVAFTLQEKGSQTLPNLSDKHVIQDAVSINIGRIGGVREKGLKLKFVRFNLTLRLWPCKNWTLELVYPQLSFVF